MKVAYKIFVPLLEIAIFPVLFFLPLLHLNITSSLAGSLSGNLGIQEYSSVFHWIKAGGQMAWVGAMNGIRARAKEVVRADIIFT